MISPIYHHPLIQDRLQTFFHLLQIWFNITLYSRFPRPKKCNFWPKKGDLGIFLKSEKNVPNHLSFRLHFIFKAFLECQLVSVSANNLDLQFYSYRCLFFIIPIFFLKLVLKKKKELSTKQLLATSQWRFCILNFFRDSLILLFSVFFWGKSEILRVQNFG